MAPIHAWSQFKCGLCTASRVSQTICGNAKIQLVIYMDDNAIDDKLQATFMGNPGLIINSKKSTLCPSQKCKISRNDGEFNNKI